MENRPLGSNSDRLGHDIIVIGGSSKSIHPEASGRESNGWPPKEGAGSGQEPSRIGCGAIANGQGSKRKYAMVVADWRFGYEGWRGVGSINPSFLFLRNENKAEDQDGHQRREYRPHAG
jgi:hypothetical protein